MGNDIGWMQPGVYHEGLGAGEPPNIDRIAHEGAKFMTYNAMQSCASGRNALVAGMYPLRTGMIEPQLPSAVFLQHGCGHFSGQSCQHQSPERLACHAARRNESGGPKGSPVSTDSNHGNFERDDHAILHSR